MLEKRTQLLTGSIAQLATQSGGSPAEASAPEIAKKHSMERPANVLDISARQERTIASTMVTETADGEPRAIHLPSKMPCLDYSSSSSTSHAKAQHDPAQQVLQPAVPRQESQGNSDVPSTAGDAQQMLRLGRLLQQRQSHGAQFPETFVKDLLDSTAELLN